MYLINSMTTRKIKLFLINPDYLLYASPPLGLAYLASYLREKIPNLDIKIIDQKSHSQILRILAKESPDIIGLSAVSENWVKVKELARDIRHISRQSKIIIGGVHITTLPSSFNNSFFDYAILGEGEIPFLKLVKLKLQY